MGQRRFGAIGVILLAALWAPPVLCGCDDSPPAPIPTTKPHALKIASLVPAATDLILAMGAGDQLVAVSNYDFEREGVIGLPRVGDYQTIDWEQISALRPDVMIVSRDPANLPPGVKQRADRLGIRLVNAKVDNLDDIFVRLKELGQDCGVSDKADAFGKRLRARLDALRAKLSGSEKVTALLTLEENGLSLAGPETYLDDLLTISGGVNAAASLKSSYPSIDREMLRSLDPQVIIQFLPNATPQVLAKANEFWKSEPGLRAVKSGRIITLTDWYVLLPGAHVADVAEKIAAALHPDLVTTRPTSRYTAGGTP
jgi:iron complex transport system substrate-binding protein